MNRNVKTSKVFDVLRTRKERAVVLEGSARSTKTYSMAQHYLNLALENETNKKEELRFIILRSRLTWLKHTVLSDFKTIAKDHFGIWNDKNFNKNESTYRLGNSEFIFGGLDHENGQKFHGMPSDYVWFNEANEIDHSTVKQIMMRMKKQAFFDYNPNMPKTHWLLTKIRTRKDCCVIHSTFKDNPFLEQSIIDEIKSYEPTDENITNGTADEAYWKIYGLGVRADVKGVIFNIKIVKEFPKIEEFCYGQDFGFSNDPTTLIKTGQYGGELYFHEELYEKGLTNIINPHNPSQPSIEQRYNELRIPKNKQIWSDSEDAKAIADLQNCGWDVLPVKKGAGSIVDGIMTMKRYPINVTEDSINLIDEFHKYKWKQDKSGNSLNVPVDAFNHGIDGCRYSTTSYIDPSAYGGKKAYVGSIKMNNGASKYGH
jgi:phage terminase large subunit